MKIKLWAVLSIYTTLAILIVFGVTMGILISSWKENVEQIWENTAQEILQNVELAIDNHLNTVIFAAKFVPMFTTPEDLLNYFVRYDKSSGYNFGSIGYLTKANGTENGKWSWQIADFPSVCPIYGYYYSDATIHPNFYGYCSNDTVIDFATRAYVGFDWGLKPEEAALPEETFLPIHDILGVLTLTYEFRRIPRSYMSFAELDLLTLSQFVKQNISVWNGQGIINIIDNNANKPIVGTSSNLYYVSSFNTKYTGLDWTTYVSINDIYGDMYNRIAAASIICAIVTVVVIVGIYFATYYWISKPLHNMKQQINGESYEPNYTPVSDFE